MDIKLVEPKDTHGALAYDVFKIDIEESVIQAWLSDDPHKGENTVLNFIPGNIDYRAIPGIGLGSLTYKNVLTYNGTMYRNTSTYAQLLIDEESELDIHNPPEFKYTPDNLMYPKNAEASDVILNIDFRTGEANILQFKGVPVGGNNGPFEAVYRYTYPFSTSKLPNTRDGKVYMDGWYTNTFVIYKDKQPGDLVVEGDIFSFKGGVYRAAISGTLTANAQLFIIVDVTVMPPIIREPTTVTFEQFMLDINRDDSIATHSPQYSATTQLLITSELNEAAINQIIDTATSTECDEKCAIADWQKLQQKRIGAYIQFTQENFRKAQVIVESSRAVCANRTLKNCR